MASVLPGLNQGEVIVSGGWFTGEVRGEPFLQLVHLLYLVVGLLRAGARAVAALRGGAGEDRLAGALRVLKVKQRQGGGIVSSE